MAYGSVNTFVHQTKIDPDTETSESPNSGENITMVDSVERDEDGHVKNINVKSVRLPTTEAVDEAAKLATARKIQTDLASNEAAEFDGTKDIEPGVTGILATKNGGTGNDEGKAPTAGTADEAIKLKNERTIRTNLATTAAVTFDGTSNIEPGVTGILPQANGGTGNADGSAAKLTRSHSIDGMPFDGTQDIGHFGICTTAASTAAKVVDCDNFTLTSGARISVLFQYHNNASAITLNVNGTGAVNVWRGTARGDAIWWDADTTVDFVYIDEYAEPYWQITSVAREGYTCRATGVNSSAIGDATTASGTGSHSEGISTVASGNYAHAEGSESSAGGYASHAEGDTCVASASNAHAEGSNATASGSASHAEGNATSAPGAYSHAEGNGSKTGSSASAAHAEGNGTTASGANSHAEGISSTASGSASHAEGSGSTASGIYAHAEGNSTTAEGNNSHAEGQTTKATGTASHAEGLNTEASGSYAHAEGQGSVASGGRSHAEGYGTEAGEAYSHAEGYGTEAGEAYSHAEGYKSTSSGGASHAEGNSCEASGDAAHAEGNGTKAQGARSHAEGRNTTTNTNSTNAHAEGDNTVASGANSHAEGANSESSGAASHAEGTDTESSGSYSHAEGDGSIASGDYSHAEGRNGEASNYASHAEGSGAEASGSYSHAEGLGTHATGSSSHAEGEYTHATGGMSHAEGYQSRASHSYSHAEGYYSEAAGQFSHAEGYYTYTETQYAHVLGAYNDSSKSAIFSIGYGSSNSNRSNCFRVTASGAVYALSAFNSSGADYAEFVKEWGDGNPDKEDRVGYFVTLKDGKLEKAQAGDHIIGITSGNPSIVGNADEDYYWAWERDEFNRFVTQEVPKIEIVEEKQEDGSITVKEVESETETETRYVRSAEWDSAQQKDYVARKDRPEWDYVGMLGMLPVRDDGTCEVGGLCKCGEDGIGTKAEERGWDTYLVVERKSDNVVVVILK